MQALPSEPPQAAIIVTGKALPEPRADRVYAVERIDRRQIEQSPSHELDQLLKDVPGVQLFRRSDARSGHPTSQGVTLRALGGNASSRALLVLDGVPQTDPFGGWINWPAYDPSDLAGIRVVRGGGSVANGPGALAGTIEMTSRADAGVSGELDGGSRQSIDAHGRVGLVAGSSVISLSGQGGRSDGFVPITEGTRGPADERAPYREWNGRARWVAPIGPATELQASLSGFHDQRTSRHRLYAEPHQWRGRLGPAGQPRQLAMDRAWLLAVAQPQEQLRQCQPGAAGGDARVAAGLGAVAWPRRELRAAAADAARHRAAARRRRRGEPTGETRELFTYVAGQPTRRRLAGGETWTSGGVCRSDGGSRPGDAERGRPARPLAGQRRAFVRESHRDRRGAPRRPRR